MEKYRDKTSRSVKRELWADAFLAQGSCRRIFLKKQKTATITASSNKFTPVQPQSFSQCNLKNMTINSYPKCRAISSTAPFRNLNCPRSLFCPNSAFFAANSPWTPRINLGVKKKISSIYPIWLSFLSALEILKFLLSKYIKRCIFRLSKIKKKISRATVDSIVKGRITGMYR